MKLRDIKNIANAIFKASSAQILTEIEASKEIFKKEGKPRLTSYANMLLRGWSPSFCAEMVQHQKWLASEGHEGKRLRWYIGDPTNLNNLDLRGADFRNTPIYKANFSDSDLSGADFSNAAIVHSNFEGAKLQSAIFKDASVNNCYIYRVNLFNANLTNANLSHSTISCTNMNSVQAEGIKIRKSSIRLLRSAGGNFKNSDFDGSNITFPYISEANFSGSNLQNTTFNGGLVELCDLSYTKLMNTSMNAAKFEYCNFYGSNLKKAQFLQSNFKGSDFTNVENIGTTNFKGSIMDNVGGLNRRQRRAAHFDGKVVSAKKPKGPQPK